jgi:hypothetical protein
MRGWRVLAFRLLQRAHPLKLTNLAFRDTAAGPVDRSAQRHASGQPVPPHHRTPHGASCQCSKYRTSATTNLLQVPLVEHITIECIQCPLSRPLRDCLDAASCVALAPQAELLVTIEHNLYALGYMLLNAHRFAD